MHFACGKSNDIENKMDINIIDNEIDVIDMSDSEASFDFKSTTKRL